MALRFLFPKFSSRFFSNFLCHATPIHPFPSHTMQTKLVTSKSELQSVLKSLSVSSRVAVDTEFVSQNYYTPSLEVIQLGTTDGYCYVVDCRSLEQEQSGLVSDLLSSLCEKPLVLHAASADLNLIHVWAKKIPKFVFDTQFAAAFAFKKSISTKSFIGLADLAENLLGVKLDKTYTMSAWNIRPLSQGMINYAANDVKYLFEMQDIMVRNIEELNRVDYLKEFKLDVVDYATVDNGMVWKKYKFKETESIQEFFILKELANWREDLSKSQNINPTIIIRNSSLSNIAKIAASQEYSSLGSDVLDSKLNASLVHRISSLQEVKPTVLSLYKALIFTAIQSAWRAAAKFSREHPDKNVAQVQKMFSSETVSDTVVTPCNNDLLNFATLYLKQICADNGISYSFFVGNNPNDLNDLISCSREILASKNSIFTNTWRKDYINDSFFDLIRGGAALHWNPTDSKISIKTL